MDYGWDWITERIALGGAFESPADADALKAAGITHVINCTELCDPEYVEQAFSVCWPRPRQPDDDKPRTLDWFHEGGAFWRQNEQSKIYVHCHAGMERSHAMVAYLLMCMGIQRADAFELIMKHRALAALGIRYMDEAEAAARG